MNSERYMESNNNQIKYEGIIKENVVKKLLTCLTIGLPEKTNIRINCWGNG